ncbi:Dabb family protein [Pseudobacteriovorax antillogorgiicola]|uniref:Stress responsive A/B Barrel Domain n=1 Tax=Pseudobacteriovorax antillogorgiicola TaxID=1513793 RepID=A0A1Y6BPG9_9BACT|nr:Dabb family protein [Pseudobacteriovorax antillogorgiicola]TCS55341.1 stress responsive alpha/beta barrel protein [Pseudobacteriovorax antillogorgiicola]SMF13957.1 Stress responsive A/B Barrel Domain [Pseudobacteriovorax antillogorgiicola]
MIEHIVLVKVKPEFEGRIDEICSALNDLKNKIDVIVDISAGRNVSARHQGFQMGLRSLFKTHEDLAVYQDHPAHVEVLTQLIGPAKDDVIALDFERTN